MNYDFVEDEKLPDISKILSASEALTFQFEVLLARLYSQMMSGLLVVQILLAALVLSVMLLQGQLNWTVAPGLREFLPAILVLITFCLASTLLRLFRLYEAVREARTALSRQIRAKQEVLGFIDAESSL